MSNLPDGVTQDAIDRYYYEGDEPQWELAQQERKPCGCHRELWVSEAGEERGQEHLCPYHSGREPELVSESDDSSRDWPWGDAA